MGARIRTSSSWGPAPPASSARSRSSSAGSRGASSCWTRGWPWRTARAPSRRAGRALGCEPCRITRGVLGRGRVLGRQAVAVERGGRRLARPHRPRGRAGGHRGGGRRVPGVRRRRPRGGRRSAPGGGRHTPARHQGGPQAGGLPACATWARSGRASCTRASSAHLVDAGVDLRFRTTCTQVLVQDGDACTGVAAGGPGGRLRAARPSHGGGHRPARGRLAGAHVRANTASHTSPGPVDIGVRVEVRNEIMETVNNVLYEGQAHRVSRSPSRTRCARSARTPAALSARRTTTRAWRWSTATRYKERQSAEHEPGHPVSRTTSPSRSTSPSPTRRRWGS